MLRCVKRSADNDVFSKKTPVILRSNREGRQRDKEVTNEIYNGSARGTSLIP